MGAIRILLACVSACAVFVFQAKASGLPAYDADVVAKCKESTAWAYLLHAYAEGENITLQNEAAPGLMPYADVRIAWALYQSRPPIYTNPNKYLWYSDYVYILELPSGTNVYPNAYADGVPLGVRINPLIEGWAGTVRMTLIGPGGHTLEFSANWNFEKPECESCGSGGACRVNARLGSVAFEIPVGTAQNGRETYELEYHSDTLTNAGASNLKFRGKTGANAATIAYASNVISSITTGQTLTRVFQEPSAEDPKRFRVAVSYDKTNPDATIHRQITVERTGAILRVVDIVNGKGYVYDYSQPTPQEWVLEESSLRRTTKSTLSETTTARITKEKIEEKNKAGTWQTISDVETHETKDYFGWRTVKSIVDPDGTRLITQSEYYSSSDTTGPNGDTRGRGRLKREIFPNGLIKNYQYLDTDPYNSNYSTVDITKEHFASTADGKETRIHRQSTLTSSEILEEEWVLGQRVSKKEIIGGATTRIEKVYPSAGGAPLVTTQVFDTNQSSPILSEVTNPDGSVVRKEEWVSNGLLTEQTFEGVRNTGSGNFLWNGTQNVRVTNAKGELQQSISYRVYKGAAYRLEEKLMTQQDEMGRPLKYDVFHGNNSALTYSELLEYCCCGLSKTTGQDGIPSFFYFDALGRKWKTHRNGIAEETIFDGRTKHLHRFPESTPSPISGATAENELSNTTLNIAGQTVATQKRSPKDGSLITTTYSYQYNPGDGVGKRIVRTLPQTESDEGVLPVSTTEFYKDEQQRAEGGNLAKRSLLTYGATAMGVTTTSSTVGDAGLFQTEISQFDWAKRLVSVTYSGDENEDGNPDAELFQYDAGGRLRGHTDPDGVAKLIVTDLKSESVTRAIDLNRNGLIDADFDRNIEVTRKGMGISEGKVVEWEESATRSGGMEVLLSRKETTADGLSVVESLPSPAGTVKQTESTQIFGDQSGVADRRITKVDGTYVIERYRQGLLSEQQSYSANNESLFLRTFLYDPQQRIYQIQDSREATMGYEYVSAMVENVKRLTRGSRITDFEYDERGRTIYVDEPNTVEASENEVTNRRTMSYWPHGGVREESGSPGYRLSYTYDPALRMSTMTTYGSSTAVTRWEYDPDRGWLTRKRYNSPVPGSGTGETYAYTAAGRLRQKTLARGVISTYSYDDGGDPKKISYNDETPIVEIHQRDQRGRVLSSTDGAGVRGYTYDGWGGLEEERYGSGLLNGWMVGANRDSSGRIAAVSIRKGQSGLDLYRAIYEYNATGRVSRIFDNQHSTSISYSPAHQKVEQLTFNSGGMPVLYGTMHYDSLGDVQRISYHNGQIANGFKVYSDYRYERNGYGDITKTTLKDASQWSYGYNEAGEVGFAKRRADATGAFVRGQSFAWNYDGIGNRTEAWQGGDASGSNLRRISYSPPNALNQEGGIGNPSEIDITGLAPSSDSVSVDGLTANRQGDRFHTLVPASNGGGAEWKSVSVTSGSETKVGNLLIPPASQELVHDADGNLTSDGMYGYTWDGENRLKKIETLEGAVLRGVPYQRVECIYDGRGRRVARLQFDQKTSLQAVEHVRYLWSGWRCIGELDSTDALVRSMVWGLDSQQQLHWSDGNQALLWVNDRPTGQTHFCHYDAGGNVVGLSDDQGVQTAAYLYDPYGQMLEMWGDYAKKNLFRFSTKQFEPVGGLYYYGFRYYQPARGRWISKDPIGEKGGVNLYGFLENDGLNSFDALGLQNIHKDPTDPKHTRQACSESVCCAENIRRLYRWMTAAEYRRANDFTDHWRINGSQKSWDNHRQQFLDVLANGTRCVAIIWKQYEEGQCIPRPPELDEFPEWEDRLKLLSDPGPFRAPNSDPENLPVGDEGLSTGQKVAAGAATVGAGYLIYRGVRMIPSVVFPVLWPSIPANVAIP
jgi:RHS repeat-associated protein